MAIVYVTMKEAQRITGKSRRRLRETLTDRKENPHGQGYLYAVDVPETSHIARTKKSDTRPTPTEFVTDAKGYAYDRDRDVYTIPVGGKLYDFPGKVVAGILENYTHTGAGSTQNSIANELGVPRRFIKAILRAVGRTKDGVPLTDERLLTSPEHVAVADLSRIKANSVLRKHEDKRRRELEKLAAEDAELSVRARRIWQALPDPPLAPPPAMNMPPPGKNFVVACPTDLHVGKWGNTLESGEDYDVDIARERLMSTTAKMIDRVQRMGGVKRWLFGAGSDWFDIDNPQNTTTRGTPQTVHGTYEFITRHGFELAARYIETLAQIAPVDVVCMKGNHDSVTTMFLMWWLAARYRGSEWRGRIEVREDITPRQVWNPDPRVFCTLDHGDEDHRRSWQAVMSDSRHGRPWVDATARVMFMGHMHQHQILADIPGATAVRLPSLAGKNRWLVHKAFVGIKKALVPYLICPEDGTITPIPVTAPI